jgi:hypothetical protein
MIFEIDRNQENIAAYSRKFFFEKSSVVGKSLYEIFLDVLEYLGKESNHLAKGTEPKYEEITAFLCEQCYLSDFDPHK